MPTYLMLKHNQLHESYTREHRSFLARLPVSCHSKAPQLYEKFYQGTDSDEWRKKGIIRKEASGWNMVSNTFWRKKNIACTREFLLDQNTVSDFFWDATQAADSHWGPLRRKNLAQTRYLFWPDFVPFGAHQMCLFGQICGEWPEAAMGPLQRAGLTRTTNYQIIQPYLVGYTVSYHPFVLFLLLIGSVANI